MSASSLCVTCGTLSHERCRNGPDTFLIRGSVLALTGPNFEKSCAGISGIPDPCGAAAAAGAAVAGPLRKPSRSSLVIRPFAPLRADLGQVDPELAGHPPHARAGVRPGRRLVVVRRRHRGRRGQRRPDRLGHRLRRGRSGRRLLLLHQRRGSGARPVARAQHEDRRALADLVADLDQHLADGARRRRGHVQRRLVRLQRQQRVLGVDLVTGRHVHLDDRDVAEVADVGNPDLGCMDMAFLSDLSCRTWWRRTVRCGRSAESGADRVELVRVDVVAGDRVGHRARRDRAVRGERGQRRDDDVVAVDLEVPAQRLAVVRAAEAVGAEHDVAPVGGH